MAERVDTVKSPLDFLLSPWMVFSGISAGVLIGTQYKAFASDIAPLGDIYLALLQMCILPIMITAIISSLGRLLSAGHASGYIRRLAIVFVSGLFLAGLLGLSLGLVIKPGKGLGMEDQVTMGKTIYEAEIYSDKPMANSGSFTDFVRKMVPDNIFLAITQGHNLAVLFFSILTGIAMGLIRSASSNTTLSVIDSFYDTFLKIIGWLMYGLPLGLLCLLADQISRVGNEMMLAMLKLVVLFYVCALFLIAVYSILIWLSVGGPYLRSLIALKETIMVALGTSSSFASIPSALRGLQKGLGLEKRTTDLVVPIGISLNPHGSVMHFAIATVFIAQIYGTALGIKGFFIVLFGSIFAGLAASGAPGLGGLSMIALALDPLGLPTRVAVILLAAIDPVIDPILTAVNVYGNCASTALIAKKDRKQI